MQPVASGSGYDRFPLPGDLVTEGMNESLQFAARWAAAVTKARSESIEIKKWHQSWGVPQINRSVTDDCLVLDGRRFERGLGTHADSEILICCHKPFRRVSGVAGLDDNEATRLSPANSDGRKRLVFSIEVGGRELWRSATLGLKDPPQHFDVVLEKADQIVLRVREVHGAVDYAHADWADLEFTLDDGTIVCLPNDPFAAQWVPSPRPPFSFQIGSDKWHDLVGCWDFSSRRCEVEDGVMRTTCIWRDPKTQIGVEADIFTYENFPAIQWVLRLSNHGTAVSPLLEEIQALDALWFASGEFSLCRSRGSQCSISDFEYSICPLKVGQKVKMSAGGGRSSNEWLPFFNPRTGGTGVISAIGWTGQWAATFERGT